MCIYIHFIADVWLANIAVNRPCEITFCVIHKLLFLILSTLTE